MLELLFSALICVVEYCIFTMFLQHYLKNKWESSLKIMACKGAGVLMCAFALTFINTFQNTLWNVLSVFTLTFIFASIFYKGKWLIKVFLAAVVSTLSIISEFMTMVIGSAVFGQNLTVIVTHPAAQVPMMIISKVLLFTIVRIIFLFKKGTKYTKMGKESLFLYTLPIVTVANIILMVQLEYYVPIHQSNKTLMALVCIGLIICNIAVFFIYDKNLKKHELENQLRQAKEMERLQANYYMQLEKGLQDSRKQLHDFKNHITTLEYLYGGKESDRAMIYMQDLKQQMQKQMALASFKVKNAAFDVILYEQNKRCLEQNIVFNKQILYNDLSFISYMDTCTIFANALDNAVKACGEITSGDKIIDLLIKRNKDILTILIENTKQNKIIEKNDRLVSTKSDKENHGFGVENIKMAVSNYHGVVSIEHHDTKFILAIAIPISNRKESEDS